jgi:Family of unknown function (DUF5317)
MLKFLRKTFLYIFAIPILFIFLGAASNQIVLIANHDKFPVLINEAKVAKYNAENGVLTLPDGTIMLDEVHCVMSDKTHLNFLADVIDVGDIESVGDLSLEFGGFLWPLAPYVWGVAVISKIYEKE